MVLSIMPCLSTIMIEGKSLFTYNEYLTDMAHL